MQIGVRRSLDTGLPVEDDPVSEPSVQRQTVGVSRSLDTGLPVEDTPPVSGDPPRERQLPAQSQYKPVPEPVAEEGMLDAAGATFKRGMERAGEGVLQRGAQALEAMGIDTGQFLDELEFSRSLQERKTQPTREAYPVTSFVGEVAGESAGLPIPASSVKTALGAGAAAGGLQFGEGGAGEFAGNVLLNGALSGALQVGGEAMANLIKEGAKRLGIKKIPDNLFTPEGDLKPEAEAYLNKEGISLDDLSETVVSSVQGQPAGADVAQAARAAQARELGVTDMTRADVSQKFDDQSREFALSKQRGTPEAEALRQTKAAQNQQLTQAGENITRGTGGEAGKLDFGTGGQATLRAEKENRRQIIRDLYSEAEAQTGGAIPVGQGDIARMFADQDFLFGLDPDVGGQLQAAKKQLEAFSVLPPEILKTDADMARIRPLTIGTAEELARNIRALVSDVDTKSQRALLPIIDAVDESVDSIAISDTLGREAQDAFRKAKAARAQFGRDYQAKDIVDNLVSFKPGTMTDKIPPSVAFDKIMNTQGRLENVQAVKKALLDAGEDGVKYWDDFRATAAAELMGKALTTGKTAAGDLNFSGANYNKALKAIGDDTLKAIFNPRELAMLKQLGRVSRDLTVLQNGVFTPSGAHVENALQRLAKSGLMMMSPTARVAVSEAGEQISKGKRRAALRDVLDPNIDIETAGELGGLTNGAINILRMMGMAAGRKGIEEEETE